MEVGNLLGRVDGCCGLQGLGLDLRHLFESCGQVLWGEVGELRPLIGKPEMRALAHDEHQTLRVSWERSWEGAGVDLEPAAYADTRLYMEAVAEGVSGRLVAVGGTLSDDGKAAAAVWTSDDSKTWNRVPHDPLIFAADQELMMWDVAAGESGFIAVGGEGNPGNPAVWTSPEGLTWTRVELDQSDFQFNGSLGTVGIGGDGFLAAGPALLQDVPEETASQITVWTSPDGRSWRPIAQLGPGYASDILMVDQAVVVAGGLEHSNDFHAAIWVGPAPS